MYRIIFIAIIFVLIATLQVNLCKRESRKAGLILPALSVIASILAVVGMVMSSYSEYNLGSIFYMALQILSFMNLPTVILMGIYMSYHGKRMKAA